MSLLQGPFLATVVLGFVLGLRHALDADHVAAVAALGGPAGGLRKALVNGISWGFGHTLTICLAGGAAILLRAAVPDRLALAFEFAAGLMLVFLGLVALRGALSERLHVHEHRHDGMAHVHLHFHAVPHPSDAASAHAHPHPIRFALRPFLVGSIHGLAGSAALALLVLTTVPTAFLGCLYLVVFGAGTTAGMALMSLALAAPMVAAQRRALWLSRALRAAAGIGSLLIGLALAWSTGTAGLFG